jgi:hypothetical protein
MPERLYLEDEVVALARRAYRLGQATFPVVAGRSALLVIDMQDEFMRPGWTPYCLPNATCMVPQLDLLSSQDLRLRIDARPNAKEDHHLLVGLRARVHSPMHTGLASSQSAMPGVTEISCSSLLSLN